MYMANEQVHLISRWPLRDGMTTELRDALVELAASVAAHEPGTLSYEVFLGAYAVGSSATLGVGTLPDQIQREVTFEETYVDRAAFEAHLDGETFKNFLAERLHHFYEDPTAPGHPAAATTFLTLLATNET